jgi:hypothetical protein
VEGQIRALNVDLSMKTNVSAVLAWLGSLKVITQHGRVQLPNGRWRA